MYQEGSTRYGFGVAPQRTTVSERAEQMARAQKVPPYVIREARAAYQSVPEATIAFQHPAGTLVFRHGQLTHVYPPGRKVGGMTNRPLG